MMAAAIPANPAQIEPHRHLFGAQILHYPLISLAKFGAQLWPANA
jgi:hypothetical protein